METNPGGQPSLDQMSVKTVLKGETIKGKEQTSKKCCHIFEAAIDIQHAKLTDEH